MNLKLLLIVLLVTLPVSARVRIQGWCEKGDQLVLVPGSQPSKTLVQQSYPQCNVTVFLAGTTTKATVYSNNAGTVMSNPFKSNQSGYWFAYVDEGNYDVQYSGGQGGGGVIGTSLFYQTVQSNGSNVAQRNILNFLGSVVVTDDPANQRTNVTVTGGGGGGGITLLSTTAPILGGPITTTGTLSCAVASGSQPGCLAAADFTTFNNKQPAGNYIVGLTGDVTATGPGTVAATVVRINGTTVTTNSAADQLLRTTASAVSSWAAIPDCDDTLGQHLNYDTTTHALSCGTSGGGSGITQLTGDGTAGPGSGSQALTFATVNSNVGTFGDSTHVPQFTVNAKGLVTSVTNVLISGGGGSASHISSGILSARPPTCSPGDVYFATDQPALQQFNECDSTNHWTVDLTVGPSGALAITGGAVDVTSIVPLLASSNVWTGYNNFSGGMFRAPESAFGSLPSAASNTGKIYIVTDASDSGSCNGSGSAASWCRSDGTNWTPLGGSGGGGGANTALSNLASVAINTTLLPGAGSVDLGSTAKPFHNVFFYGNGTFGSNYMRLQGTPTGARTITFPDASDTVVTLAATQTLTNKSIAATQLTGALQAAQFPAQTGDVTNTAGSLTTIVGKVNGVTYPSAPSTHQTPVVTASNTVTYKTIPDCQDTAGNHLNYTQSTDSYSCGTSGGGGTGTEIVDSNGNPTVRSAPAVPSAVNYLSVQNAATGAGPFIAPNTTGTDTDIPLHYSWKGNSCWDVVGNSSGGGLTQNAISVCDDQNGFSTAGLQFQVGLNSKLRFSVNNGGASSFIMDNDGSTTGLRFRTASSEFLVDPNGNLKALTYATTNNCASSASPAVCGDAAAGRVVVAVSATTVTVNTTKVTANSEIMLQFDASLGAALGVTCNTTYTAPWVSARTAGTSFTITTTTVSGNPACYSYSIVN